MNQASAVNWVSSADDVRRLLAAITSTSTLSVDLEGKNLGRTGTITLITMLIQPAGSIWLIDVLILQARAFYIDAPDGKTLKSIFADASIAKLFWDVRNDAAALWSLYSIGLHGVVDVQLLENASRRGNKTFLRGLASAMKYDAGLSMAEIEILLSTKTAVSARMEEDVFSRRPLDAEAMQYCANDVIYLPKLREVYQARLHTHWLERAKEETLKRVKESVSLEYVGEGPEKARGPWPPPLKPWVPLIIPNAAQSTAAEVTKQ